MIEPYYDDGQTRVHAVRRRRRRAMTVQILYETCDGWLPGPTLTWTQALRVIREHRRLPGACPIKVTAA